MTATVSRVCDLCSWARCELQYRLNERPSVHGMEPNP